MSNNTIPCTHPALLAGPDGVLRCLTCGQEVRPEKPEKPKKADKADKTDKTEKTGKTDEQTA